VVGPDTTAGIVSDIDDTVMITSAPWPLLAVWNTFVVHETTRRPVPGMADLFDDLLREHPGAPVMYLSTRAWNAAPAIRRFLGRFGYPAGPLLLTDWGPTRTGWFRDGADHKRAMLRRLTAEFPQIQWILVGDDGQRDPRLYTELALEQPDRVRAVAIRQLSGAEQAIVHGSPAKPSAAHVALQRTAAAGVPVIAARNGIRLAEGLREAGIDLS
jgi:phosphatidate phosphatase APP1